MVVRRFIHVGWLECSRDVTFLSRIDCPRQDQCSTDTVIFSFVSRSSLASIIHHNSIAGCSRSSGSGPRLFSTLYTTTSVPPRTLWVHSLPILNTVHDNHGHCHVLFYQELESLLGYFQHAPVVGEQFGRTSVLGSEAGIPPGLFSTHSCGPLVRGMLAGPTLLGETIAPCSVARPGICA